MENIREALENILENPPVMGIIGLVIGVALGLLYGWVINPVDWVDADIPHLREDLKVEYLRLAVDSYVSNPSAVDLAQTRWDRLGDEAPQILEMLESNPGETNVSAIQAFSAVVSGETPAETPEEGTMTLPQDDGGGGIGSVLKWALLVTILIAGALVWWYITRSRTSSQSPAGDAQDFTENLEATDYSGRGEGPPMHQFATTYVLGDNLFDDSFSIESAGGDFLGECGIGISESIGVGEPKRVTAFEVWLFDQNDIATITKVLMSDHAYHDESMLVELEKKGEPVLATSGTEFVLESKNLRIIARVIDLVYGTGPLPEDSFFERMALELSIWQNTQVDTFTGSEFGEF